MKTPNNDLQAHARERVEELKAFYSHLFTFLVVNTGLFIVNLTFSPGRWWFLSALFAWGIGLSLHALATFRPFSLFSKEWEERKMREFMNRQAD